MRQKSYLYTLLAAFLLTGNLLQAQEGEMKATISYAPAMPVGSFSDHINKTSLNGWNVNLQYGISDKFSIGGGAGFNDFYKKYPRQVYKTGEGSDISAVLTNSVQVIPVTVNARYHFMPESKVQPYAGINIGANIILYEQLLGEYSNDSKSAVGFTGSPVAGVFIPFSKTGLTGIDFGAAYNYMPFKYGDINGLDNLSLRLGISFPLRN